MSEQKPNNNAVIIGGGLSGLATASLLAKLGWRVTLLEKNSTLGGRARVLIKKGFRFDMGPSWYMMPEVFDRFFALFGRKTSDFYTLVRLDPRYTVVTETGQKLSLQDDQKQNEKLFEQLEPGAGASLVSFLSRIKRVYTAATKNLMYEDVWDIRTWLKLKNWKEMIVTAANLQFFSSWQKEIERHFKNTTIKKIVGFPAVFLGGSPYNTPALFSILNWSDFGTGIWYPQGGIIKVVDALEKLAKSLGVTILTDQEVEEIVVADGRVSGVRTSTTTYNASVVVGAMDLQWLETRLLQKQYQSYPEGFWKKKTLGISAFMMYLGLDKRYTKLTHHMLCFTQDWQRNFDEIFKKKTLPTDPSLYLSVPSLTDRSIVPAGSEAMMVLVPVGSSLTYSPKELKAFGAKIMKKIETTLGIELDSHCTVKEIYTPNDFAHDYRAYNGTALGLAHTLFQSLWWRPNNKSNKVKGLYYAGQYSNPGVGMPMALVSAQMVSKMIGKAKNINQSIFKRGSTTYYYSSVFFQGQVKKDVFTLYAYVRIIDDLVDQQKPQIDEMERMWQETKKAWEGETSSYPVINQFIELAKRKKFIWEWVEAFWQAMRSDLVKKEYSSFSDLEIYMYGSAEVVGLMMAKILDLPKKALKAAALQGKAMQLLNIIRDVKEDAELGRKYMMYKDEWKHNQEKWSQVMSEYLQKYYAIQAEAEKGYAYIPKQYLIPIKTAAEMYFRTAKIIEKDSQVVWQRKVKPSKWSVLFRLALNAVSL